MVIALYLIYLGSSKLAELWNIKHSNISNSFIWIKYPRNITEYNIVKSEIQYILVVTSSHILLEILHQSTFVIWLTRRVFNIWNNVFIPRTKHEPIKIKSNIVIYENRFRFVRTFFLFYLTGTVFLIFANKFEIVHSFLNMNVVLYGKTSRYKYMWSTTK